MNDRYQLKSWQVEGSTDGSTLEIIDNKVDTTYFQNNTANYSDSSSQKHFPVQFIHKYNRYIRITSTGMRWDYFTLFCVELFGFIQSD